MLLSLLCVLLISSSMVISTSSQLIQRNDHRGCICPGDTLIFVCSVSGGVATIWRGTVFQCLSSEITLRHKRYAGGISGVCNSGAITASSIGVSDNNYTSQLNVTVSPEMNNKSIECVQYSNTSFLVGSQIISLLSGIH